MDFSLTPEQEMFKNLFCEFASKEVAPIAAEIDISEEFPLETVRKMSELGFMGMPISREYGGAGSDTLSYIIGVEEISKACASTGAIFATHVSLVCQAINLFGTEEQKRKYLVPLAQGKLLGAFCLTEPNAGTDASNQQSVAIRDNEEYILNGTKVFITNGGIADIYIVMAMTDPSKGTRGISTFILEKDTLGFSFGKKEDKMGIRASCTRELIFTDCHIPKKNIIGKEGDGFKIALTILDGGRIGIAAQALGIAQAAYDEALKYAKERQQFNKSISTFQAIQFYLADMALETDAARLLVYRAACLKDKNKPFTREAAMAKLYASEVAMKTTIKAIQIHGGYGYMKDYKVERLMRDAKITEIYEGTSEVMRMVIASTILK